MREEQHALMQEGENMMAKLRSDLQECEAKLDQSESAAYTARQQIEEINDEKKNLEEKYLNFVATRGKGRNLLGLSAAFILVFLL